MRLFSVAIAFCVLVISLFGASLLVQMGLRDPHSNFALLTQYLNQNDPITVEAADVSVVPTSGYRECVPEGELITYLSKNGIDTSMKNRRALAIVYDMANYQGKSEQDSSLLWAMQCKQKNIQ